MRAVDELFDYITWLAEYCISKREETLVTFPNSVAKFAATYNIALRWVHVLRHITSVSLLLLSSRTLVFKYQ